MVTTTSTDAKKPAADVEARVTAIEEKLAGLMIAIDLVAGAVARLEQRLERFYRTIPDSATQVAEIIGLSVASVRRWRLIKSGPKYLKVGGAVRYRQSDIGAWLDSRPTGGSQEVQ